MISKSLKYTFFLTWCAASFIISILIFSNGLLLHREELPYKASCFYERGNYSAVDKLPFEKQFCTSSKFKVILLLIDALRYDFVEYQPNGTSFYHNRLTAIHDALKHKSKNTVLYKFLADPPTTTMQRIKGLTTGSFPTFVDIGASFGSNEITEDNILDVLVRNEKKIVFMGDDTWMQLFPNRFLRSYPFDSFNVWDLDSVDQGIKEKLFPELKRQDWHFLIAHFLGVDHCGHRYSSDHPEMARKLTEMNDILKRVMKEIEKEENTLLFLIGDHGMTFTGDHGGESENEISTAIFAYSPVHHLYKGPTQLRKGFVSQVDLVPTLSSIFGLPIPFSSTGSVILECIPVIILDSVSSVRELLWKNVQQIMNAMNAYSSKNSQLLDQLKAAFEYYSNVEKIVKDGSTEDVAFFLREYELYLKSVLEVYKEMWLRFDYSLIFSGILFMFLSMLFFFRASTLTSFQFNRTIERFRINLCVLVGATATVITFYVLFPRARFNLYFVFGTFMCFSVQMYWLLKIVDYKVARVFRRTRFTVPNLCMFLVFVAILGMPFSNSYVLEEPKQILFLFLPSLWILVLYNIPKSRVKGNSFTLSDFFKSPLIINTFLLSSLYRVVLSYAKCREEENPNCKNENVKRDLTSLIISALSVVFFITLVSRRIQQTHRLYLYVSSVLCLLLLVHWTNEILLNAQYLYIGKIPAITLIVSISTIIYIILESHFPQNVGRNSSHLVPVSVYNPNLILIHISVYLCVICMTVLEQPYSVSAVLLTVCLWYLANIFASLERKSTLYDSEMVSNMYVIMWFMSSIYWFYVTGHNTSFSAIQWNAAFLLQKEMTSMIVPGLLVMLNTFISYFVHGILLQLLVMSSLIDDYLCPIIQFLPSKKLAEKPLPNKDSEILIHSGFTLVLRYFSCFAIRTLSIMIATTVHRRHLMVWKVFVPKFIFEGMAFLIIIIPSSLLGFILIMYVSRFAGNKGT